MASPIADLRAAGFGDDEISAWSAEKRKTLTDAGFKDNEVDAYLSGGPVVPDGIPKSFIERFQERMQSLDEVEQRQQELQQESTKRIVGATLEGWTKGFGERPIGFTPKAEQELSQSGVFRNPENKSVTDGLRLMNEAWMRPTAAAGDAVFRSVTGVTSATGHTIGQWLAEHGMAPTGAEGAKRDWSQMLDIAALLAGAQPVARVRTGPMGETIKEPIGTLPKSEDFANVTKHIAGDEAPPLVQEKMLRLYEEHGVHPAEVAQDVLTDPVKKQALLSSDPEVLPYVPPTAAKELPIVRFRRDAAAIEPSLPPVEDGFTRLWRGNRPDEVGLNPQFTNSLDGIALPFREAYGGPLTYVDVPTARLDEFMVKSGAAPGAEFIIPPELAKQARIASEDGKLPAQSKTMAAEAKTGDVVKSEPIGGGGKPPAEPPRGGDVPPSGGEPPKPGSLEEAQSAIRSKISVGESEPRVRPTLDKLYTEAVDSLHPIKGVSEDAYQIARLSRGQFGKAEQFLERGTFDFKSYENNGPSLRAVLEPVRNDLDGWRTYAAAQRAIEIEQSGRKSGMDLEAAKRVVQEGADKYEAVTAEVRKYQNNLLKYLKDSGVLTEKSFEAMRQANQNYIPFYRLMGEQSGGPKTGKGFGPGNPVKKLKGSDREIVDPLESIIKNTYAYISVAERNAVGTRLVDALKKAGLEVEKKKLPAKDADLTAYLAEQGVKTTEDLTTLVRAMADDGETISAFRNGVKESVKVNDPDLVRAFRGLDTQNLDMLTRILAVPARTLRAGAVLTPDFIARNIVRDFLTAFTNTKGALFTPLDTVKGLKSVITKDADFEKWLKSGGANSTMVALDRRYLQESLQKLTAETGLMDRAWNIVNPINAVKTGYRGLQMMSELAENATRLGEFKKVLKGSALKEDIQKAGFASREVTLDFARIGASMRAYNAITAFGNAQIQGLDRIIRAFKDNPVKMSARVAGGITLPSMLLWWANHDDPRYKELPAWQKDLFWIVMTKDHIYRIPKPFETGVIFGSGVERILDATVGKNPEAFDHFGKSVMDMLSPNFIPTAAQPMVEQFANRSTFADRTLIPHSMEKFLPEYQYTEYTTEASKALGKIIAAFPGVRDAAMSDDSGAFGAAARAVTTPILIENYIRAWSGGLGTYALQTADKGLKAAGVLPDPPKPEDTLADVPFVKAFVIRYPSASAQSIQDFYDGNERAKKFQDTWMAKAREGDVEAMSRIQAAGGPMMFARMDGIANVLAQHSKLVRDIYKNPSMPPAEKRQLIDQLYNSMIDVAKSGKQIMKTVDEAGVTVH